MAGSGLNILLVVLDSVRADHLGCYGAAEARTPEFDALAAAGVRFSDALGESTWTLPMAATLLTGLTPREHRMEITRQLPETVPTLPGLLREAGYATFGASANAHIAPGKSLARGFETFVTPYQQGLARDLLRRKVVAPLGLGDSGGSVLVEGFRRWVRRTSQPWFATVWLNDAHHPYRTPGLLAVHARGRRWSPWRALRVAWQLRCPRRMSPTPWVREQLEAVYANALRHMSRLVGRLAEEVSRGDLGDRTLLIVVGDHGDMLGERGLIGHGPAVGMYQPLVHVPMILRGPDVAPTVSPALVQMADVTQTVAAVAGVAHRLAPTTVQRVDLRAAATGVGRAAAFCNREPLTEARAAREAAEAPTFDFTPHLCDMTAVVADGWKLITREPGPSELYHLAEDPRETRDLLAEQPQRAEYLRGLVDDYQARTTPNAAVAGLARDDSEIVDRRLRELGYL